MKYYILKNTYKFIFGDVVFRANFFYFLSNQPEFFSETPNYIYFLDLGGGQTW